MDSGPGVLQRFVHNNNKWSGWRRTTWWQAGVDSCYKQQQQPPYTVSHNTEQNYLKYGNAWISLCALSFCEHTDTILNCIELFTLNILSYWAVCERPARHCMHFNSKLSERWNLFDFKDWMLTKWSLGEVISFEIGSDVKAKVLSLVSGFTGVKNMKGAVWEFSSLKRGWCLMWRAFCQKHGLKIWVVFVEESV